MSTMQVPLWVNILSVFVALGLTLLMAAWPRIAERRKARRQGNATVSNAVKESPKRVPALGR